MSDLSDFKSKVFWLVWNIPEGQWISYGSLAAYAGSPRAARQVGGMAHYGPTELPWHRVVKKDGELANGFPGGSSNQKELLQEEGVEFRSDKIKTPVSEWVPSRSLTCKLVVIVGETASGKSSIGLSIADQNKGSIICADSWTVRKGLDIGTAKPSLDDQRKIPHYMLDIVEPDEYYSAGLFQQQALDSIKDIKEQERVPIMISGNGLYTDSVLFSYSFLDEHNETLRKKLQSMSINQIRDIIEQQSLNTNDVDMRNKRRLMRLIETNGATPTKSPAMRPNTLVIGIRHSRTKLRERVEKRVELMFRQGLRKEVEQIYQKYGKDCEAMKGIGYREFIDYFEGEKSMTKVKSDIVRSTLGLAKRQRTWFKKNQSIVWCDRIEDVQDAVNSFLATSNNLSV